ncbi:PIR Superfamily Protein [Plasmodium ovale curtisi]|uniref:PIR Superfamily Protein n=1 Tax=Plasmodium ovale curtisi TaxID=864141 RepID=A0A1A8XCT6_PLAOA|nr:PIR Superfamily Protein [Plasmodium ovale curtisi]SBT03025.1 PIR Superfamily Protein [Plasmodium ovale curtisi]
MPNTDKDLSVLPSFRAYYNLNKSTSIEQDDNFWSPFRNILKETKDISSLFDELMKGIYYASYMSSNNSLYKERWNFLYFWMGEKVFQALTDTSQFSLTMYKLNSVKEHFEKKGYDFEIYKVKSENFKDLKNVYDYLQNVENIKGYIYLNSSCTAKYKKYIEDAISSYRNLEAKCLDKSSDDFCSIFHAFITKYKKENYLSLACNGLKPPQEYVERDIEVDVHFETESSSPGRQMNTRYSGNSSIRSNIMTFVYPLLAIFIIFFTLYKFTSLGSLLRIQLKRGKQKLKNKYEEAYIRYSDNSEIDNIYSDDIDQHISYHSI